MGYEAVSQLWALQDAGYISAKSVLLLSQLSRQNYLQVPISEEHEIFDMDFGFSRCFISDMCVACSQPCDDGCDRDGNHFKFKSDVADDGIRSQEHRVLCSVLQMYSIIFIHEYIVVNDEDDFRPTGLGRDY